MQARAPRPWRVMRDGAERRSAPKGSACLRPGRLRPGTAMGPSPRGPGRGGAADKAAAASGPHRGCPQRGQGTRPVFGASLVYAPRARDRGGHAARGSPSPADRLAAGRGGGPARRWRGKRRMILRAFAGWTLGAVVCAKRPVARAGWGRPRFVGRGRVGVGLGRVAWGRVGSEKAETMRRQRLLRWMTLPGNRDARSGGDRGPREKNSAATRMQRTPGIEATPARGTLDDAGREGRNGAQRWDMTRRARRSARRATRTERPGTHQERVH